MTETPTLSTRERLARRLWEVWCANADHAAHADARLSWGEIPQAWRDLGFKEVDAMLAELSDLNREVVEAGMKARRQSLADGDTAEERFRKGHAAMIQAIQEGK